MAANVIPRSRRGPPTFRVQVFGFKIQRCLCACDQDARHLVGMAERVDAAGGRGLEEPIHVLLHRLPLETVQNGPRRISPLVLHRPLEVMPHRLHVVHRCGAGEGPAREPDQLVLHDLRAARREPVEERFHLLAQVDEGGIISQVGRLPRPIGTSASAAPIHRPSSWPSVSGAFRLFFFFWLFFA